MLCVVGCESCGCNLNGVRNAQCNEQGKCKCAENVNTTTEKCDICLTGNYGLPEKRCKSEYWPDSYTATVVVKITA